MKSRKWMTKIPALVLAGWPLGAATAAETDVSYDYVELRFVNAEFNAIDGDGFEFAGSYNFSGNWIVQGSVTTLDYDFNLDTTETDIGVGYVWPTTSNLDLYAVGAFVRQSVDTAFGDASENGYRFGGGIRARFDRRFEARAELNYVDVAESTTFITLGGDYYFNDQVAAGVTLDLGGDADFLTLGARYFFGDRRVRR